MTPKKSLIDPMYVRKPESFEQPRTIPKGWDLTEFFVSQQGEDEQDSEEEDEASKPALL